ncbi:hypothetical protein QWA68_015415 [Fusarium oxysporum]|nr:hypothetical protein QWA68_015415 [Fusarium oxysporum]
MAPSLLDQLPAFGTNVTTNIIPTLKAFTPLLTANADIIKTTRTEEFSYGSLERQKLDIYYPITQSRSATNSTRVLLFVHGSGFVFGGKIITEVGDGIVYRNLGHFFAKNYGFTVVIPNYRLVQHDGVWPSGGEDLALSVQWIKEHLSQKDGYFSIDLSIMGESAGGINLGTYLFSTHFQVSAKSILYPTSASGVHLKAVVFLATPFHLNNAEMSRAEALSAYFGGSDSSKKTPLGLLVEAAKGYPDGVLTNIKVAIVNGTLDSPHENIAPRDDFLRAWEMVDPVGRKQVIVEILEGHNHISPTVALSSADEKAEAWGHTVGMHLSSI